jgi:glutamate-5-semialdehyde dehydrogenase
MAARLRQAAPDVLAANARDMEAARRNGLAPPQQDRLFLDAGRIEAVAKALDVIAAIPDPVGAEIARWDRPHSPRPHPHRRHRHHL